jgi:uncharacterized small protein (DUF1192 family)
MGHHGVEDERDYDPQEEEIKDLKKEIERLKSNFCRGCVNKNDEIERLKKELINRPRHQDR